ncbi:heterokaryon incompatibility protein-domain-containing protein [Hypomontagnella monticulosa]|nr:heterokaryon incompatibility protein-domain-containing protein [Hypomontagnella monticulosa]
MAESTVLTVPRRIERVAGVVLNWIKRPQRRAADPVQLEASGIGTTVSAPPIAFETRRSWYTESIAEVHCDCSNTSWQALLQEKPRPVPCWTTADLCLQCRSINFDTPLSQLYRTPLVVDVPGNQFNLRCSTKKSECPACRFFATIFLSRGPSADLGTVAEYRLQITHLADATPTITQIRTPNSLMDDAGAITVHNTDGIVPSPGQRFHSSISEKVIACVAPVFDVSKDDRPAGVGLRQIDVASVDYALLRDWITHCQNHHKTVCKSMRSEQEWQTPVLRVIECQTRTVIDAPADCEFVALSYVWGSADGSDSSFKMGPLPADLPQTIDDAIQVVLGLRHRYLWVDRYCINQCDKDEMGSQLSVMDVIYDAAVVTIIAACGDGDSFGLPGVGPRCRREQPTLCLDGRTWVSGLGDVMKLVQESKWAIRGWTYQEGLFSRRRLIFTEEQVYFECNNSCYQESTPFDLHSLVDDKGQGGLCVFNGSFNGNGHHNDLSEIIKTYSQRSFSFPRDILDGLAGVFRFFGSMPSPVRQYWGIPMDYYSQGGGPWPVTHRTISLSDDEFPGYVDAVFARALCWRPEMESPRRVGFPSWSWAGWMSPLYHSYPWDIENSVTNSEIKIWVQRTDSTFDRLDRTLIEKLGTPITSAEMYNPTLCVEAWAIRSRLKRFRGDKYAALDRRSTVQGATYAVFQLGGNQPVPSGRRTIYCPVDLSVEVEDNDELFDQVYDCIILEPEKNGLLTKKVGHTSERIGIVDFEFCYFDVKKQAKIVEKDRKKIKGGIRWGGWKENYNYGHNVWDFLQRYRHTIQLS